MSRRREKPEGPVQRILKLLENVRRCGNGWSTPTTTAPSAWEKAMTVVR